MPSKDHLHIYERVGADKSNARYRCIDPECTHYSTKDMIKGNKARCECGTTFILDSYCLGLKRPRCMKCSTGKRREQWERHRKSSEAIKEVMKGNIL